MDRNDEFERAVIDEDDQLLDPWFFKSEEEIAAIEDDPTARVIELRIAPVDPKVAKLVDQGTGFEDKRWAF